MLCLWWGPPGFNCRISFTPVFSCIYCRVLIFVSSPVLYLDFYLLGNDTSIRKFHANLTSICLDPHQLRLAPSNMGQVWYLIIDS